jgi:hypothetical protein
MQYASDQAIETPWLNNSRINQSLPSEYGYDAKLDVGPLHYLCTAKYLKDIFEGTPFFTDTKDYVLLKKKK